jgi:hypothetical protein
MDICIIYKEVAGNSVPVAAALQRGKAGLLAGHGIGRGQLFNTRGDFRIANACQELRQLSKAARDDIKLTAKKLKQLEQRAEPRIMVQPGDDVYITCERTDGGKPAVWCTLQQSQANFRLTLYGTYDDFAATECGNAVQQELARLSPRARQLAGLEP